MPFGFTNAPATFCTLMNKVLEPFLDHFVVVYLDDIMVYNQTMDKLVEHFRQVFQALRSNELYVKKEKCSFAQEEVMFLSHIIGRGKIRMDQAKDPGHIGVGTSRQGDGAAIFLWLGKLLPEVY